MSGSSRFDDARHPGGGSGNYDSRVRRKPLAMPADSELTRQEHMLGLRLAFVADDTVEATPG